jgi:hypothetical protein
MELIFVASSTLVNDSYSGRGSLQGGRKQPCSSPTVGQWLAEEQAPGVALPATGSGRGRAAHIQGSPHRGSPALTLSHRRRRWGSRWRVGATRRRRERERGGLAPPASGAKLARPWPCLAGGEEGWGGRRPCDGGAESEGSQLVGKGRRRGAWCSTPEGRHGAAAQGRWVSGTALGVPLNNGEILT